MTGNGAEWGTAACCAGLCAALLGMLLAARFALRWRGGAALPMLSLLIGRDQSRDDAAGADWRAPAHVTRPDLRAIAKRQDFDAALQAQRQPPLDAPPGPDLPPAPPAGSRSSEETRPRDEDEEFGSSENEEGF